MTRTKWTIILMASMAGAVLLPLCMAQVTMTEVQPVALSAFASPWVEVGTITAQNAYPAVANRDYTTVAALPDANMFTWTLPNHARRVHMSFQTTSDADSTTLALMGFADAYSRDTAGALILDDAVYLGQLVLTGGKQVGKHTNVYVDTIVATDGVAAFSVLDSAGDRRCVVEFPAKYKIIYGIATTLQGSSTLYIEGRLAP